MARPSIRKYIQSSGSTILVVVQRDKVVVVRWWPGPDASWLSPPQSSKLHTLSSASLCWAVHCSHWQAVHCSHWQPVHCSHWQDCTVHTGNLWTVKLLPLSWAVLSIIWQLFIQTRKLHYCAELAIISPTSLCCTDLIWSDLMASFETMHCNARCNMHEQTLEASQLNC